MFKKIIISCMAFTAAGAAFGSFFPGIGTLIGGIGGFALGLNGASLTGRNKGTLFTGIGIGAALGGLMGTLIPIPGVGTLFGLALGMILGSVVGNILTNSAVYLAKKELEPQDFSYRGRFSSFSSSFTSPITLGVPHRSSSNLLSGIF